MSRKFWGLGWEKDCSVAVLRRESVQARKGNRFRLILCHRWMGKWCETILYGCVSNALRARLMRLHIAVSVSCQNSGARDKLMKAGGMGGKGKSGGINNCHQRREGGQYLLFYCRPFLFSSYMCEALHLLGIILEDCLPYYVTINRCLPSVVTSQSVFSGYRWIIYMGEIYLAWKPL